MRVSKPSFEAAFCAATLDASAKIAEVILQRRTLVVYLTSKSLRVALT
jgi:hypothetical protein